MNKKVILWVAIILILAILAGWCVWDNHRIGITEYTIRHSQIPESFNGYKILQISDLHNRSFGSENRQLLDTIRSLSPDIIVLTGDLIDSYHTNVAVALDFVREVMTIAPCYYVMGNHEVRIPQAYETLKSGMEAAGVHLLEENLYIEKEGRSIELLGVPDPSANHVDRSLYPAVIDSLLASKAPAEEDFSILLCHRPEVFAVFQRYNIDLALCGHTHGGQIRLPLLGAIYCPDQGLFPQYDTGIFEENGTTMVISRGLGNSSFPFRFNCPPEIVVITLCNTQ